MIWTQEQGLIPAAVPQVVSRGCGCISAMVLGSLAAVVLWFGFGLAWWWGMVAWVAAFVLGSLAGRRLGTPVTRSRTGAHLCC